MIRVVMLLASPWETDSRVIREATALAQDGYEVHVISDNGGDTLAEMVSKGVIYHCLAAATGRALIRYFPGMIILHWRVQAAGIRSAWRMARYGRAAVSALRWVAMLPALIIALVCAAILFAPFLVLKLLLKLLIHWLSFALRPLFPKQRSGHAVLLNVYAGVMLGVAWLNHKLWAVTYRMMRLGDFNSIQYLNQYGTRAFELACRLQPDIVHSHDLVTLSGGYAVARATGAPLIYDAHELETHTNYWTLTPSMRSWIAFYEEVLSRKTDAVVTVCESIADWLRDHYCIPRPVVVHNTPEVSRLPPPGTGGPTLRDTLGLGKDVPLAVYVGSVTIDRGIEQCVQALALAPDVHMAFVGPRYSETERQIRSLAAKLDVTQRVHLVDPVLSAQVTHFVSDADCSLVTIQNVCLSYYFCFPNKLLESVLAGVPVVAARLIELERFVERFHVGLIADETDPTAIAHAIQTVIRQKSDFQPDAATRQEIVLVYGWATQRERLLELYARLSAQTVEAKRELTGSGARAMSLAD